MSVLQIIFIKGMQQLKKRKNFLFYIPKTDQNNELKELRNEYASTYLNDQFPWNRYSAMSG